MSQVSQSSKGIKRTFQKKLSIEQLQDVSDGNLEAIREVMVLSKSLHKKKRYKDANKLLEIAESLLRNNRKYQDMVVEVLTKTN